VLSDVKPRTTRLWAYRKTLKRTEGIHENIRQTLTTGKKVRKLQCLLSTGEKEKLAFHTELSAFILIIFLFCYCNNRLYFLTTEKHEREKKTERRSYFLIMLRAKMQICLQVGGKFSEELEKGECCEKLAKVLL